MRKLLVKIIQVLDGTPAIYGKRQAGQSVVELALITPLLIILLAGLVEIGWFANNYLNLLDVTRAGARRGAVLQDQQSPLFWTNQFSYVPNSLLSDTRYQMPNTTVAEQAVNGTDLQRWTYRWVPSGDTSPGNQNQQPCDTNYTARYFYNEITCTMITSMDPLTLNPEDGIDDIIVSAFSLQLIQHQYLAPGYAGDPNETATSPEVEVVGRYPTNANECDVQQVGGVAVSASRPGDENRDPFDINGDGVVQVAPPSGTDNFSELSGYDAPHNIGNDPTNWEADAEKQVGFSLYGNHKIDNTFCVGSDWTLSRVEQLMNLPDYDLSNTVDTDGRSQKGYLPSEGLVLVEMYWDHTMLLKMPLLSPVFTAVGRPDGTIPIYVWAAFPLQTAQPDIAFS